MVKYRLDEVANTSNLCFPHQIKYRLDKVQHQQSCLPDRRILNVKREAPGPAPPPGLSGCVCCCIASYSFPGIHDADGQLDMTNTPHAHMRQTPTQKFSSSSQQYSQGSGALIQSCAGLHLWPQGSDLVSRLQQFRAWTMALAICQRSSNQFAVKEMGHDEDP